MLEQCQISCEMHSQENELSKTKPSDWLLYLMTNDKMTNHTLSRNRLVWLITSTAVRKNTFAVGCRQQGQPDH